MSYFVARIFFLWSKLEVCLPLAIVKFVMPSALLGPYIGGTSLNYLGLSQAWAFNVELGIELHLINHRAYFNSPPTT